MSPLQHKTPLPNETPLNINKEDDEENEIIDADKFNLQEARHTMESEQDKLSTTNVFIELLSYYLGSISNEINSKHLKLTKQIAYCETQVKSKKEKFMT